MLNSSIRLYTNHDPVASVATGLSDRVLVESLRKTLSSIDIEYTNFCPKDIFGRQSKSPLWLQDWYELGVDPSTSHNVLVVSGAEDFDRYESKYLDLVPSPKGEPRVLENAGPFGDLEILPSLTGERNRVVTSHFNYQFADISSRETLSYAPLGHLEHENYLEVCLDFMCTGHIDEIFSTAINKDDIPYVFLGSPICGYQFSAMEGGLDYAEQFFPDGWWYAEFLKTRSNLIEVANSEGYELLELPLVLKKYDTSTHSSEKSSFRSNDDNFIAFLKELDRWHGSSLHAEFVESYKDTSLVPDAFKTLKVRAERNQKIEDRYSHGGLGAYFANPVNCLVIDHNIIVGDPCDKEKWRLDSNIKTSKELDFKIAVELRSEVQFLFESCGFDVHFVPAASLDSRGGGFHCGTFAIRTDKK